MSSADLMREKFPDAGRDDWFSPPGYSDLVALIGKPLAEHHSDDYQGDSRYLLVRGEGHAAQREYAYLCFGWGSCSGCDALQACDSYEELAKLYDQLANLQWRTLGGIDEFVGTHDWDGDYRPDEGWEFAKKANIVIKQLFSGEAHV